MTERERILAILQRKKPDRVPIWPFAYQGFARGQDRDFIRVLNEKITSGIRPDITFLLDCPVILKKNIWHGIITLSRESEIKLTENANVKCVYWPLGFLLGK